MFSSVIAYNQPSLVVLKMVVNNFYKTIKPATYIYNFLGILPISYTNDKIVLFKYTVIVNALLLIFVIWQAVGISLAVLERNIVEAVTFMSLAIMSQMQYIVSILQNVVSKKKWLDLANAILETDTLFSEIRIQLSDGKLKKDMYSYFIAIIVLLCVFISLDAYLAAFDSYFYYVYSYAWIIFNSILSCCVCLHILRVREGFKAVNSVLKERINGGEDRSFELPLKHLLSSLCKIHHTLTKIINKLNGCFGMVLLATITASLLANIAELYTIYKDFGKQNIEMVAGNLVFCFAYIANNLYLCHVCEITVQEVHGIYNLLTSTKLIDNVEFSG